MANFRQVNTFFWDDPYIEELSPEGKLLFLYLITNPLTNLAGSFEITLTRISNHTGLSRDTISGLLRSFEEDGKCIYRDKWMLVCNTIEHQHWRTHATIRKGIETIVSGSPDWVKDRLCIAYEWLSHLKETNINQENNNGVPPVAAVAAVDRESSIVNGEQPTANGQPPTDPWEDRIWKDGTELCSRSGMSDKQARPFLGRMAREYTRPRLAEAIAVTMAANPPDPKAYMIGVLQQRAAKTTAAVSSVGKYDPEREITVDICPRCGSDICCGGKSCEERAKSLARE